MVIPAALHHLAAFAVGIGQGLAIAAARHARANQRHIFKAVPKTRGVDPLVCTNCRHFKLPSGVFAPKHACRESFPDPMV
jgi:hypothetical protein